MDQNPLDELGELLAAAIPEHAVELAHCIRRYVSNIIKDRDRNPDKEWERDDFLRDLTLTTMVFCTLYKYDMTFRDSCREVAQGFNAHHPNKPMTQFDVETVVQRHDRLGMMMYQIVSGNDRPYAVTVH